MRLLHFNDAGNIRLAEFFAPHIPRYAILSHRWGQEEVTFDDIHDGTAPQKRGYCKLEFCGNQARDDGLVYFWVDTCCINKKDGVELREAINSMFQYYRDSAEAYVYLEDVSCLGIQTATEERPGKRRRVADNASSHELTWQEAFQKSIWFTRAWTLQELIAPTTIGFFSEEGTWLGDKKSLEHIIHGVTRIPVPALRNDPMSNFSVEDRISWMDGRVATRKEDKAYALLGILGVRMDLDYGEGEASALARLKERADLLTSDPKTQACIRDLKTTNPTLDKLRIQEAKGGLLEDVYHWVLETAEYQQWQHEESSRLLWIKGDPGKGKTMLMCGIIDKLQPKSSGITLIAYFFCQASDARINNASAVLRGLIFMLVTQQPMLISHLRKQYDLTGKQMFEDVNSWVLLKGIFIKILNDPAFHTATLLIDGLDECVESLELLLDLVREQGGNAKVRWIVSGRNWINIEKSLTHSAQSPASKLSLELNEELVSSAVQAYVHFKVEQLARKYDYDASTRLAVQEHLSSNAHGTFLWVALVCQELDQNEFDWEAKNVMTAFPPGLDALYKRMIDQIHPRRKDLLIEILAIFCVVSRPLTLDEIVPLASIPSDIAARENSLTELIGCCASFLAIRDRTISFVHQSARDFLLKQTFIFPLGPEHVHYMIFKRSLEVMSQVLTRDIYKLKTPGIHVDEVEPPKPNPLDSLRYSCVYWVDHFSEYQQLSKTKGGTQDDQITHVNSSLHVDDFVYPFLTKHYLHWLEVMSLLQEMPTMLASLRMLAALFKTCNAPSASDFVQDAIRFYQYHIPVIGEYPLQTYVSALLFSPTQSSVRKCFDENELQWITTKPAVKEQWSACLTSITVGDFCRIAWAKNGWVACLNEEGIITIWHATFGRIVGKTEKSCILSYEKLFHHETFAWTDESCLVFLASDKTLQLYNPATDQHETIFENNGGYDLDSAIYSSDGCFVILPCYSGSVVVLDTKTGQCKTRLSISIEYWKNMTQLQSDGTYLVALEDNAVKAWDLRTGVYSTILQFGQDRTCDFILPSGHGRLAASLRSTLEIWNIVSGTFERSYDLGTYHVQWGSWSCDGRLAILDSFPRITILDFTSEAVEVTYLVSDPLLSGGMITWSSDGLLLASMSGVVLSVWDPSASASSSLKPVEDILSIALSSTDQLATLSSIRELKIWDLAAGRCRITLLRHAGYVTSVAWSNNGQLLASDSLDGTVKIWNAKTGNCQSTLQGHTSTVGCIALSNDGRLASADGHGAIKIWDTETGHCINTLDVSVRLVRIAWSYHGRLAASNSTGIQIWNPSTSRCEDTLEGRRVRYSEQPIAWSVDGLLAYVCEEEDAIGIWNTQTGQHHLVGRGRRFHRLQFDQVNARHLHTEKGTIDLSLDRQEYRHIGQQEYAGYGTTEGNEWVTFEGRGLVRIPSEFMHNGIKAVSGSDKVAFVARNSRLFIFIFAKKIPWF